jgi:hypothetical protein
MVLNERRLMWLLKSGKGSLYSWTQARGALADLVLLDGVGLWRHDYPGFFTPGVVLPFWTRLMYTLSCGL